MIRALRVFALALAGGAASALAAAPSQGQTAPAPAFNVFDVDLSSYPAPRYIDDEDKFPKEDPKTVDRLEFINAYVNTQMTWVSDDEHYGRGDYWYQAPVDRKGDCEDFAITKLYMLGNDGWDEVDDMKLVFVQVYDGEELLGGHAILAVHLPNGSVAFLDNMNNHLMTHAELVKQGDHFQDWSA